MSEKKTHREVKRPKVSARYLADYMASSERLRRTIVRDCRYRPIARVVQHDRAKNALTRFLLEGGGGRDALTHVAEGFRQMLADSQFEQDVLDNNADYVDAFADALDKVSIPDAERYRLPEAPPLHIHGVEVRPDIQFGLRRVTRTNKVRTGLVAFRYAKGKALPMENALWQSSFLYGYRLHLDDTNEAEPERKLCITLDAYTGQAQAAPGDALARFRNMEAACQTISERWDSIPKPEGAIL